MSPFNNNTMDLSALDNLTENFTIMEIPFQEVEDAVFQWDWLTVLRLLINVIITVVGSIGNLFVIGAVLTEKQLKYIGNTFVVSLAMADLIVTGVITPITTANVASGKMGVPEPVCYVAGFLVVQTCATSMANLAFIAFDRYIAICFSTFHRTWFHWPLITCFILFCWMQPGIVCIPPFFFGMSTFGFDRNNDQCTILYERGLLYNDLFIFILIGVPMILSCWCYISIFRTVRASKKSLHKDKPNDNQKQDNELYITLFLVFFLFLTFWAPYGGCVLLNNWGVDIPPIIYLFSSTLGVSNSIINSFIYGFTNKNFRSGYIKILKRMFPWWPKRRVAPQEATSSS